MRQLHNGGYAPEYLRVASGKEMREALEQASWDIVIIDYAMPGFSALAALDLLKETGLDVPRIIVSGTIGEETAVETMKAGADDYIMKDNLSRLVPAIERELREAQSRKERRKAEEALRISEERYRCLVENIDIGVTLIDSDYNVIMTNEAQSRLYGKVARDLVGLKCYNQFGDHESVCPQCPGIRAMESGRPCEIDMQVVKEGGDQINLRVRSFPIFGEGGVVTGFIKVVDDVTERKRLEEQLRQAAQLEAIGRLAGGVAHDFNNLLTAMIGYSSVLLSQMPVNDPGRERVAQIRCAAERAAELTRQLLAFSRKQVLDVKVLDLNPLIVGFQRIIRRLLGEDVEILTALAQSIGRVKADAGQIEQILMNLAVNARDAMPSGGKLTMETANIRLDKDYARTHPDVRPGPYVMIAVSDNGVGMNSETRAQIFDPFFTTKERGKGTGLGLSMVYGIVKQHQGHISVYSEPGRGTTFKVYLPLCEDTIDLAGEAPAPALPHAGTETVLVVEDDEIVLRLACEALEILGYTVLSASHPLEAVQIGKEYQGPIQLLLTDVVLPQMDGPSLFRVLLHERPTLKVLYVSGYASNFIVHHGVLDPGVHFLQKPFTVEDLAAKIRETLGDGETECRRAPA
jgi:PAS domain S-box-containing protein